MDNRKVYMNYHNNLLQLEEHMYPLVDVDTPNVFRNLFPYDEVPKIAFNDRIVPHSMPDEIWITDTTFRDGQQSRAPYTTEQIVTIYNYLHRLGGPEGKIRQSEFFLYSKKDRDAVYQCLEKGYQFPEVTSWIRASKKDFETARRKKFCARIATGDYDAVIIGHSQFEKIPVSAERQERILTAQIDEIENAIAEMKSQNGERFSIKQMEKTRKGLEARLEKLRATDRKDDVITFEQLGVDRLFVDEAHAFKNLFLYTKMRNVAGLSTSEAQKSSDMFMKCQYMDELTGGRGIIFATGTPVSNSMTELYTMMRYLQYGTLQQKGLTHFDSWASTFGETTTAIELAPEGTGYRARTRFAKFFNLPELMNMFKEVADIKTSDQLHLPVPEAKFETVVVQPSEHQQAMVAELSERAAAVHSGVVDPSVDNMLKITSDGRKLGLDQRLMNPLLPDDPNSKLNACVRNVLRIYEEGQSDKLTQLLFCDRVAIRCYK